MSGWTRYAFVLAVGLAATALGVSPGCGGGRSASTTPSRARRREGRPSRSTRIASRTRSTRETIRGWRSTARRSSASIATRPPSVKAGVVARPGGATNGPSIQQHAPCDSCHKDEFAKPPGPLCKVCHDVGRSDGGQGRREDETLPRGRHRAGARRELLAPPAPRLRRDGAHDRTSRRVRRLPHARRRQPRSDPAEPQAVPDVSRERAGREGRAADGQLRGLSPAARRRPSARPHLHHWRPQVRAQDARDRQVGRADRVQDVSPGRRRVDDAREHGGAGDGALCAVPRGPAAQPRRGPDEPLRGVPRADPGWRAANEPHGVGLAAHRSHARVPHAPRRSGRREGRELPVLSPGVGAPRGQLLPVPRGDEAARSQHDVPRRSRARGGGRRHQVRDLPRARDLRRVSLGPAALAHADRRVPARGPRAAGPLQPHRVLDVPHVSDDVRAVPPRYAMRDRCARRCSPRCCSRRSRRRGSVRRRRRRSRRPRRICGCTRRRSTCTCACRCRTRRRSRRRNAASRRACRRMR